MRLFDKRRGGRAAGPRPVDEVAVKIVLQTRVRAARILMFFVHTQPQTILKVGLLPAGGGFAIASTKRLSYKGSNTLASSADFCLGRRRRSVWVD